jgi:hypothetical protein
VAPAAADVAMVATVADEEGQMVSVYVRDDACGTVDTYDVYMTATWPCNDQIARLNAQSYCIR